MTGDLCPSGSHLFLKYALERWDTDVFQIRDHPLPLCVESTDEMDIVFIPEGETQGLYQFSKDR